MYLGMWNLEVHEVRPKYDQNFTIFFVAMTWLRWVRQLTSIGKYSKTLLIQTYWFKNFFKTNNVWILKWNKKLVESFCREHFTSNKLNLWSKYLCNLKWHKSTSAIQSFLFVTVNNSKPYKSLHKLDAWWLILYLDLCLFTLYSTILFKDSIFWTSFIWISIIQNPYSWTNSIPLKFDLDREVQL